MTTKHTAARPSPKAIEQATTPTHPVPGADEWIARAVANYKTFSPRVAEAQELPADTPWLRGKDLVGVPFVIVSFGQEMVGYQNRPAKQTARYKIVLQERPELGLRTLDLQSRMAIAQLQEMSMQDLPMLATCEVINPERGEYASIALAPARAEPAPYYHAPFGEKAPADENPF